MPKLREPESRRAKEMPPIEEIEASPTDSVTVEIAEEEPEQLDLLPETPETPKPADPPAPLPEDGLKAALEAQRRAEELQARATRERDEALRAVQHRDQELARERGDREQAQYDTVVNAIGAQQERLEAARRALRSAKTAGDMEAELEAIDAMSDARAELKQLEAGKYAYEARQQQRPQPQPQPQPQDPPQSRLPPVAQQWLDAHPEYKSGWRNVRIGEEHQRLVERGVAQFSPQYFDEIENALGIRQAPPEPPSEPEPPPAPAPTRRVPVSAPVSREAPSAATGRPASGKITLSAEQREIAHKTFTNESMSNAEKEKLYAIGLQKYQNRRANGYRDEVDERGER